MPIAFVVDFKHIKCIIMMEDQCLYHIGTSQLIWIANQLNVFIYDQISDLKWEMPGFYRYAKWKYSKG